MASSKKRARQSTDNKRAIPDLIDTLEIVPGIRLPLSQLLTESGRQEAELLRREWLRKNRDPEQYEYVGPEKLSASLPSSAQAYFELDAQKFICRIAELIARRTAYRLGPGEHPDAPRVVVERVREILHAKIQSELREFVLALMEDTFFETLLSLEGELKFTFGRAEVRKEWGNRVAKRAYKKRRKILSREGLFPTPYLLRAALSEAVGAILNDAPDKRITQSEVVKYFSESNKYANCGDESTLRLWLRTHGVKNWKELVKELRREYQIKSRFRV